ncbi:hypothetical protein [Promicromonospora sp. NPDC090134]|uniref:hypothetical protein n=1 Tax=Promicromonospora sp. NPDC090134 TaxID=3364408 RepID=UPI0037FF4451
MSTEGKLAESVSGLSEGDRAVLDRRFRTMRGSAWVVAAAAVLSVMSAVLNRHDNDGGVMAYLGAGGVFAAFACAILATHPFLLLPRRYLRWLLTIEPYEPETYWGQSAQRFVSWAGACLALVLGGIVGAELGAQQTTSQLSDAAWQWTGLLLLGGFLYFWWTRFLIELAFLHRRALRRGQLATHPAAGTSVWLLFVAIWGLGILATGLAAAAAPFIWQEFLGLLGTSGMSS